MSKQSSCLKYLSKYFCSALFTFLCCRTLQTHPSFCSDRNPEGCTHHLPPRREIWNGVVPENDKDDKWGKHTSECRTVLTSTWCYFYVLFLSDCVSQVVRARVKDLLIPRYKFVVLVHIGQLCDQSMQISSRCLWDSTNDTFATYSFKNSSLFGVGTVYAVYYE